MNAVWFVILAGMLTAYAVLDGFDLGVGALLLILCRTEEEKQAARDSIGPVWNGNEVWLIASGGAMFMAFPKLYSASFSGFYLALMLVLWLLILRGVGFEFRHAYHNSMWTSLWDLTFSGASLLLAVLFGVAVGNVLRGVPLDSLGEFQGSFTLLLNPFSILAGILSLVVLCLHGASFLAMKTEGVLHERASQWTSWIWFGAVALVLLFVASSFLVRPTFEENYLHWPILLVLPLIVAGALAAIPVFNKRKQDGAVFAAGSVDCFPDDIYLHQPTDAGNILTNAASRYRVNSRNGDAISYLHPGHQLADRRPVRVQLHRCMLRQQRGFEASARRSY